ncbi:MAG: protein kinase domain-containing protein, partial [Streptosporangiaceae bacterium]
GEALAAAHEAGLVHRDIKPQNILLSLDGLVKLTDFGISFAAGAASLTSAGTVLGTSGYLAPERLEGGRGTAAGDVYALGVVAYQALAGQPPFTGTPAQVADAHHSGAWPPLPPGVPAEVTTLIGTLTARDPALRPSAAQAARRAAELRERFGPPEPALPPEPAFSPEPAEPYWPAEPASPPAPPRRWARPPGAAPARPGRVTLGLAAVAVLALLGWALASLFAPHGQHPSAAAPNGARMVEIDGARLRGQAVPVVRRELRRLGLIVRVRWRLDDQVPPGVVLSVQPTGRVPARSVVVVTGARRLTAGPAPSTAAPGPRGPGHGQGHGHGKGHKHKKKHGPGKPPKSSPSPTPSPQPASTSPSPTPATSAPTTSTPAARPAA